MAGRFTKGPTNPFYIDDAKVIYPWFSGKMTPMNREGDKNFGLVLNKEQADMLLAANYQVKESRPKDPDTGEPDMSADPRYHVKCKINFDSYKPPRIILITCIDGVCKREPMSDTNIILLDTAEIEKVDVKIEPYDREASDTRTAYVQSAYFTVNLDRYDAKYNDLPWSNEPTELPPPREEDPSD